MVFIKQFDYHVTIVSVGYVQKRQRENLVSAKNYRIMVRPLIRMLYAHNLYATIWIKNTI